MSLARQVIVTFLVLLSAAGAWLIWSPSGLRWLDVAGLSKLSLAPVEAAEAPQNNARGAPVQVATQPASLQQTAELVTSIGDGRAVRSVTLSPEVSGRVVEIAVSAGEKVTAGQTVLQLESSAQEIEVRRAALLLEDAKRTAERARKLTATGAVTELQQVAAELAEQTAELAQREAELELSHRKLVSPIDGNVGFITPEVGDQVSASTVVTQIDDRSSILIDFRLPERLVARVDAGMELEAVTLARPDVKLVGRIHAVDTRVEQASRSFRVQAELENADDLLRPGMAFRINMSFPGDPQISVYPLSVQWNGSGSYVWVVREGRSQMVPVTILERRPGQVLVRGDVAEGEAVVVEGVQNLRPNRQVTPGDLSPTTAATPSAAPRQSGRDI